MLPHGVFGAIMKKAQRHFIKRNTLNRLRVEFRKILRKDPFEVFRIYVKPHCAQRLPVFSAPIARPCETFPLKSRTAFLKLFSQQFRKQLMQHILPFNRVKTNKRNPEHLTCFLRQHTATEKSGLRRGYCFKERNPKQKSLLCIGQSVPDRMLHQGKDANGIQYFPVLPQRAEMQVDSRDPTSGMVRHVSGVLVSYAHARRPVIFLNFPRRQA